MSTNARRNSDRTMATSVGALFITATVAGVLSVVVLGSVTGASDTLTGVADNETQVVLGALLILIMSVAIGAIPVMLFSVLKRHSTNIARSYVMARVFEVIPIIVSAIILIALVLLSQEYQQAGSPDEPYFQMLGNWLLATRDSAELIGTQIFFSLTALILNYSLYQTKIVPRIISVWGFIGALLIMAAGLLALFSLVAPFSTVSIFLYVPIALQEMVFAVWLIVKGFDATAIDALATEIAG